MNDRFTGLTIADYLDMPTADDQDAEGARRRGPKRGASTEQAGAFETPPPGAMTAKPWVPPRPMFRRPGSEDYRKWPSKGGD